MSDGETKKGFGRPSALEAVRALQGVLKLSLYELDNDENLTPLGEIDGDENKTQCCLCFQYRGVGVSCQLQHFVCSDCLHTNNTGLTTRLKPLPCSVGGCSAPYKFVDLSQVLPSGIFSQYRRRADMAGNYLRFMQPCFTPEMFQTFEQLLKGVLGQVEFGNRTVSEDVKGVLRQVELGNSKLREVERKLTCTLSAIRQLDNKLD